MQQYAAICSARARELRVTAAGQLQRAARYLALRDEVWHGHVADVGVGKSAAVSLVPSSLVCNRLVPEGGVPTMWQLLLASTVK